MKTFKKVLASTLAAAMVVTALPVTPANAAAAPKLSTTKAAVYVGQSKTIKVTTPKTWKSVKVKATTSKKSVAKVKASKKKVTVKAVKAGTAKVTVKVTGKKSGKAVKKTLKATITVKNPALSVSAAGEVAVGSTEAIKATVKPAKTKVTYTTSDEKIATVDAKGVVTGVAAGDVTITVKAGKTTKTVNMTVKKAILKSADQTEYNKIEAVIVGDTKDMKAGDIKVTNTATKATVAVKSVSAKKGAENTYVIETFTGMTDAKEYSVEYAGAIATFTATDGTVANVALTKTEVPAGIKTEVKAVTKDAKGVTLGYFDLTNANSAKGQVTTALTITKGYVQGTDVYLPAVGDTMVAKLTYHTGSFAADGKETGVIENTATITAVDPSTVTYNYAVTIGDSTPKWTATSFKAVTSIKVGTSKKAYFRITDENGKEISSYEGYSVETADSTKLVIDAQNLTKLTAAEGTKGLDIRGVAAGDTYILVKKDGKVAFSIPVSVQGKATATSIDLNKTSVTVMSGAAGTVSESIEAKLKDQYTEDMEIKETPSVENLAKPDGATAPTLNATLSTDNKKATVTVNAATFASAAGKTGTYTYKITLKDSADKAIVRTFTINVVNKATVQAYQLNMPTEKDTTVKKDSAANDYVVEANIVEMANGAKADDYTVVNDTVDPDKADAKDTSITATKVVYTVKDATGKDITEAGKKDGYISQNGTKLTVKTVSSDGMKFEKKLAAGTYYVTGTFKVRTKKADGTYDSKSDLREVKVSGSFTVKDSQDTAASIEVKKNDLENTALTTAFAGTTYVKVTYDGVEQALDVAKIHGTIAGNTAYVSSVEVYVNVTGSSKYVLVKIPVNQKFTNVNGVGDSSKFAE